jgi:catechol 2,3-dioxygenase-like lactoylglutathione lyase family enzyme
MKIVWGDVAVVVEDAQKSAKWWQQKCGFELRDTMGHWVTVAPPGATVVLHLCSGHPKETGNTGIGFYVDDVKAIHTAWTKKGVVFTKPVTQGSASVNAMFADLDGNEYWLFEDEDLRAPTKIAKKAKAAKRATTKKTGAKKAKAKSQKTALRRR